MSKKKNIHFTEYPHWGYQNKGVWLKGEYGRAAGNSRDVVPY